MIQNILYNEKKFCVVKLILCVELLGFCVEILCLCVAKHYILQYKQRLILWLN